MTERRQAVSDRRLARRGGRRQDDHAGKPVVLITDDHTDSRDLLATVLQEVGVTVAEAPTGQEALRRAMADPLPSLILMDLSLPDVHGADVVRALKAHPRTRDIPVVALTASVTPADKAAAREAGCAAFLEKPVMPDEVISLARRLLAGTGL